MFYSTKRRGLQMKFENGLIVSVKWGAGNDCHNSFPVDMDFSCDAEICVIYKSEFLDPKHFIDEEISSDGDVAGHLSTEQVAKIIYNASTMPVEVFLPWYKEARGSNIFNNTRE